MEVKNLGRLENKDCSAMVSFRILYDCDIYSGELSNLFSGNDCRGHNTRIDAGISDCILDSATHGFPIPNLEGFD
jgi:hypothetical protein